jgi:hypothetical protein
MMPPFKSEPTRNGIPSRKQHGSTIWHRLIRHSAPANLPLGGISPSWSLITLVPLIGFLIVAGILAFAEWPASRPNAADQGS